MRNALALKKMHEPVRASHGRQTEQTAFLMQILKNGHRCGRNIAELVEECVFQSEQYRMNFLHGSIIANVP